MQDSRYILNEVKLPSMGVSSSSLIEISHQADTCQQLSPAYLLRISLNLETGLLLPTNSEIKRNPSFLSMRDFFLLFIHVFSYHQQQTQRLYQR